MFFFIRIYMCIKIVYIYLESYIFKDICGLHMNFDLFNHAFFYMKILSFLYEK